ncbi:DUF6063 family protein [Lysinibacillus louembei]|uniref:DUF6063 family protein n=1 Tax=Lysinibacillus louembei TaxID=1470088 RepID=A0ABZ0RSR3_9BACI|nr:DUF6063 family protein [Lysinibacillus louembei]WPK10297.1 DUF6063 family protein [Lysinibacillus louembei]
MLYQQEKVERAFEMYSELAMEGRVTGEAVRLFKIDTDFRALVEMFCKKVQAICIEVGDEVLLVPETRLSPFHVTNEALKREYFKTKGRNEDLYLMYFATICVIGEFYNAFHSIHPTRPFITIEEWIQAIDRRMATLREYDEETLKEKEKQYSYRWHMLLEKWDGLDDVKETAKRQSANTMSRVSFLHTTCRFLRDEEILIETGIGEFELTEKAKVIIGNYFMDSEYNRGIIAFLYSMKEEDDADHY